MPDSLSQFENDVNQYGTQTEGNKPTASDVFDNDVNQYVF